MRTFVEVGCNREGVLVVGEYHLVDGVDEHVVLLDVHADVKNIICYRETPAPSGAHSDYSML